MKDSEFIRREAIPMTKEEIRYISLGYLEIQNAKKMLDIGSGTGSVSLEALTSNPLLKLTAIEYNKLAYDLFIDNMNNLELKHRGLTNRITLLNQKAPCNDINELFDRIFIGGTSGDVDKILDWTFDLLEPNGILVMNFITLENLNHSINYIKNHKGFTSPEGGLVSINKFADIGPYQYLKPNNPTFILKTIKN